MCLPVVRVTWPTYDGPPHYSSNSRAKYRSAARLIFHVLAVRVNGQRSLAMIEILRKIARDAQISRIHGVSFRRAGSLAAGRAGRVAVRSPVPVMHQTDARSGHVCFHASVSSEKALSRVLLSEPPGLPGAFILSHRAKEIKVSQTGVGGRYDGSSAMARSKYSRAAAPCLSTRLSSKRPCK